MIKAINNTKLFQIAHNKTKNFRIKFSDVSYSVQLGIFLKEVYKLKKLIENKINKVAGAAGATIKYLKVDTKNINGLVVTLKVAKGNKNTTYLINKRLLDNKLLDIETREFLKEIYNYIHNKLNIENKIKNFDKYIAPSECQQLSLF